MLTLNCWGVTTVLACKLRPERMRAIAEELSKGEYDIVILQEIWAQDDYEKLCARILSALPYTHYFHSGNFGCGICIFSKYMILETFHFRYTLNGYAHKIFHGDWFCGKSICLAKIQIGDLLANVYGTHLHAQYHEPDNYEAHRIAQSFEMSQFIRNTSESCDLVIVGGDFNFRPDQLGYNIIRYNGNLYDSWIERKEKPDDVMAETTSDRPDNSFTPAFAKVLYPKGIRIDYLMYRPNSGVDVVCETCYLTMRKVPGQDYNYSDHEGVAAVFTVKKNITAMGKARELQEIEKHLSDAIGSLDHGVQLVKSSRVFYSVLVLLCVVAISFSSDFQLPFVPNFIFALFHVALIIFLCFCIWMARIGNDREMNGFKAAKKDVNNLIKSLHMK